jgi:glycosyltransferase involved in cell wall biosynthesis
VSISVILPARNAEQWLDGQLRSLANQSYAGDWELVVADNGSTDATRSLALARAGTVPRFQLIDAAGVRGAAHARNAAVRSATGDMLLFCDADDVVGPEWISALASALSDWPLATGPLWSLDRTGDQGVVTPEACSDEPVVALGTWVDRSNMAVRRDLFEEIGGFDEDLLVAEDMDFGIRADLAGATAGFAPRAIVLRREPTTVLATWKKRYAYGRGRTRVQRRYPQAFPKSWMRTALRDAGWVVIRLPYAALPRRRSVLVRRAAALCGNVAGRLTQS